jgi:TolB protein
MRSRAQEPPTPSTKATPSPITRQPPTNREDTPVTAAAMPLVPAILTLALAAPAGHADDPPFKIGYTRFRTNIEGSRWANAITARAWLADGSGANQRELAAELVDRPGTWTQFAGWSSDGATAIIGCGFETEANGLWEEENKQFRFQEGDVLYDTCLLDLASNRITNLTAVDRVSFYNTGVFYWPNDPTRLGFQALIGGESHPFSMNLDGTDKRDLSGGEAGFSYGYSASPDGTRISYHRDYQIYVADADGGNITHVDTGNPFNFCPTWSPDGSWLLFVSGEHYDCHPYVVRADGSDLHKLADRGGYSGVVTIYDVFDHHGGSSDTPVWAMDGRHVYYTCKIGESVELMRVSLDGEVERLTESAPGVWHYHPSPSPDGEWLLYGSNETGTRQLYVSRPDGSEARQLTDVPAGSAAMHGRWQPHAR